MPGLPQTMSISLGKLIVGYPSGFRMWDLEDNAQTPLLALDDPSLQFISQSSSMDACLVVEVRSDLPSS